MCRPGWMQGEALFENGLLSWIGGNETVVAISQYLHRDDEPEEDENCGDQQFPKPARQVSLAVLALHFSTV